MSEMRKAETRAGDFPYCISAYAIHFPVEFIMSLSKGCPLLLLLNLRFLPSIVPIDRRRDACVITENASEIVSTLKTALDINISDGQFCVTQQTFCAFHTLVLYILSSVHSHRTLHLTGKLTLANAEMFCKFCRRQLWVAEQVGNEFFEPTHKFEITFT